MQGRLEDLSRDRFVAFHPLPGLMAVDSFEVIEVVLDPDRLVVPTGTIEEDPFLPGNSVEEARQAGKVREVIRLVHQEEGEVETLDLQRARDLREVCQGLGK